MSDDAESTPAGKGDPVAPHRTLAFAGFVLFAVASGLFASRTEARLLWSFDVPSFLFIILAVLLALPVYVLVRSGTPRWIAAHSVLTVVLVAPVVRGVPSTFEWMLALAAAGGVVLYVENFAAARRLGSLFAEAPPGAADDLADVTRAMRRAESLPTIIAVVTGLVVTLLAPLLYFPVSGVLVESLEARGLVGAAVAAGVVATVLGIVAFFRHRRRHEIPAPR